MARSLLDASSSSETSTLNRNERQRMSTSITRRVSVSRSKSREDVAPIDDDMAGIDGDIARIITVYARRLRCTRADARAALIRHLSALGLGRGALRLEETC